MQREDPANAEPEAVVEEARRTEERLNRLAIAKSQSIDRACALSTSHDRPWKEEINILAQLMEQELILRGQQSLTNHISREIAKTYREKHIKIWPWVHDYLPTKFKLKYEYDEYTRGRPRDLPPLESESAEDSSFKDRSIYEVQENIAAIPSEEVAEMLNSSKRVYQALKKRAQLEHIAEIPDENSSNTDQINDGKQNDREHVTIDKPRPHGSLTREAMIRNANKMLKVADRVTEFPPEILEKDEEIALGWDTWGTWMDSALDLKYSKSWLDWFRTEKWRDVYGKHAAAVMSFSLTNLCATCSDEKTKEWVRMEPIFANSYATYQCLQCQYQIDTVCPNCNLSMKHLDKSVIGWQCSECDGTIPLKRDLTREQVGDKSSIIVDAAMEVLNHIPSVLAFCVWYSDWIEPRIASRKIRLSDDLSERA